MKNIVDKIGEQLGEVPKATPPVNNNNDVQKLVLLDTQTQIVKQSQKLLALQIFAMNNIEPTLGEITALARLLVDQIRYDDTSPEIVKRQKAFDEWLVKRKLQKK